MVDTSSMKLVGRRYLVQGLLGRGGMGAVYRAIDRLTGQPVALKQVLTSSEDALSMMETDASSMSVRIALAHEFQTLASLRHPHIIPVLDYGFDEDKQPYFTMSLLEKPQTVTYYGRNLSLAGKIQLVMQMLQALAYLHQRGIIHCDLKPENALVAPEDGLRVLDFGLAILQDQRRSEEKDVLGGTLAYMAPEVMQGTPPSVAADLYAVGVMAYELFAGHYPFEYETISQLLQHVMYTPADVGQLDVDYEVSEVVRRLLEKEPQDRYQSAYAAIEALSKAAGQDIPLETAAIRESYLQGARFVGRESEMTQLRLALQTAVAGPGTTWLIGGETGVGKSRLNEELRIRALVQGAAVLRGQAVSGGGLPYQLWREPLRRLVLMSDIDDLDAGILKDIVPDIEQLLGRTIPDVVQLEGTAYQQRLVGTIASLFQRQSTPMLLLLEDLQWAVDSLEVLKTINNLVKDLPLMVIANYRHDENPGIPAQLPEMNFIRLERLTQQDVQNLTVSIMGDAGYLPAINSLLMKETGGNVFFLIEIVRVLAEEVGRLQDIGRKSIPRQVFAGGIQQAIVRRLKQVPDHARDLLQLAAAAGRDLDLKMLLCIAGTDDLEDWLTICANCSVLEVDDSQWSFPYDQLREVLLNELSASEQADLYRRIAEAIETVYPDVPEQALVLAQHWRSAGNVSKELFYARRAGEYMLRISALTESVTYFRRALELIPEVQKIDPELVGEELRSELLIRLGEALKYTGDYTAAHECLAEALELRRAQEDKSEIAQALLGLGDVVSFQGDLPGAVAFSDQALRLYREVGTERGIARATSQIGRMMMQQGEYTEAIRYCEESLGIS
ncbi:MAG TPA: protein kinase, partial [Phototrophicaceae bacterium]|nr:protein kinase [Phototrophicaceae bacterium]